MSAPSPTREEADLLKTLDRMDSEGKAARSKLGGDSDWNLYLDLVRGAGSRDRTRARMFEANLIGNAIERKAALLTEQKPEIYIAPMRSGFKTTAEKLQQTIGAGWDQYNMALQLETLVSMVQTFGAGAFYIGYDPRANHGRGDLAIYPVDPRNFVIDPMVTYSYDTDTAQYLQASSVQSLWDLQMRFPGRGSLVKPDPRVSSFDKNDVQGGRFASILKKARGSFQSGTRGDGAVPRAFVRDYYFQDPTIDDGRLKYPFGRNVLRAGEDVILEDRANPFFDGGWPYLMLDGRLDLDHPWGGSDVQQIRRIQEGVNRIGHMFVENAILTGNTWVIGDHDALPADQVRKLSNIGGIYLEKKLGRTVERQAPPPMPPHLMGFIQMGMQLVDFLTGLGEGSAGAGKRMEVRSGAQLEGLQHQAQTLVRAQARRLESFLERLGTKWIARIFQFYTDDRLMLTLGADDQFKEFAFERQRLVDELSRQAQQNVQSRAKAEQRIEAVGELQREIEELTQAAWKDFRFKIKPGSSLAMTKQQRALVSADLAKNGIGSRRRVLIDLGVENPDEELAQVAKEMQQFGPPAAAQAPSHKGKKAA